MRILIEKIFNQTTSMINRSEISGRWIYFSTDFCTGNAILISPKFNISSIKKGDFLEVETSQHSFKIRNVHEDQETIGILELEVKGDYLIVGKIEMITKEGVVIISVYDGHFDIVPKKEILRKLKPGRFISFCIKRLFLYDTMI